eukprot:m.45569 g.45569  ORF g.45569 m.45569 type:complete len:241 (-) comp14681_c0_seq2:132-854(-)
MSIATWTQTMASCSFWLTEDFFAHICSLSQSLIVTSHIFVSVVQRGKKRVKIYGSNDFLKLYPNPLGYKGRTIQSQVDCDAPDLTRFPEFQHTTCYECEVNAGEMLFIPAFYWHQVTTVVNTISVNYFFGDRDGRCYLAKIMEAPRLAVFTHWLLNIVEQNRSFKSFERTLQRLPEALQHFLLKQWHDTVAPDQLERLVRIVLDYLQLQAVPPVSAEEHDHQAKNPVPLKIRGLRWRKPT